MDRDEAVTTSDDCESTPSLFGSSLKGYLQKTLPILIESGMFDLNSFVHTHIVLKKTCNWLDYVSNTGSLPNGEARFHCWKRMLIDRPFQTQNNVYFRGVQQERVSAIYKPTELPSEETYRKALSNVDIASLSRFSNGVEGEIMRDVVRSYQTLPLFQEHCIGREMLTRVLVAISNTCKEVGYCQGMNFVVGAMVIARLPSELTVDPLAYDPTKFEPLEIDVFSLALSLIPTHSRFAMQGLWGPRIPRLKLRVYQLDRLMRWYLPRLHTHLESISLNPEVLTAQWFITLFAYVFPVDTLLCLWEYLFLTGWEGIFRIAVSILTLLQPTLLAIEDMEGVASLLREWRVAGHLPSLSLPQLFRTARDLLISDEVLLRLQESYAHELLSLVDVCVHESDCDTEESESDREKSDCESSARETDREAASAENKKKREKDKEKSLRIARRKERIAERASALRSNSAPPPSPHTPQSPVRRESEKPTLWLLRYGKRLTSKTVRELRALNTELHRLDEEIDRDKQLIQAKILRVCESHREAQEQLSDAIQLLHSAQREFLHAEALHGAALREAHSLAENASVFIDALDAHAQRSEWPVRARLFRRCVGTARENQLALSSALSSHNTHTTHTLTHTTHSDHTTNTSHTITHTSHTPLTPHTQNTQDTHNTHNTHTRFSSHSAGTQDETFSERGRESDAASSLSLSFSLSPKSEKVADEEDEEVLFPSHTTLSHNTHTHTVTHTHTATQEQRERSHTTLSDDREASQRSVSSLLHRARRLFHTGSQSAKERPSNTENERETDYFDVYLGNASNTPSPLFGSLSLTERATSSLLSLSPLRSNGKISSVKGAIHLHAIEAATQQAQQRLVNVTLRRDEAHKVLVKRRNELEDVRLREEELSESKRSLCDQLQLLVEDSNRGRSQKLLFVTDHYVL